MLRVQRTMCSTCIFRPDTPLDLKKLVDEVRDPRMGGFFVGSRICHHSRDATCRGFWDRYKDRFAAGQVAQRLDCVEFVNDDI